MCVTSIQIKALPVRLLLCGCDAQLTEHAQPAAAASRQVSVLPATVRSCVDVQNWLGLDPVGLVSGLDPVGPPCVCVCVRSVLGCCSNTAASARPT